MTTSTPAMDAVERAFRNGIVPGPPADPTEQFLQVGMLSGRRIIRLFWSRDCPVDLAFTHTGQPKRLAASGTGPWFEPVCRAEAFIFCVAPLSKVQGAADFPKYPFTPRGPLNQLAEWARSVALPGGAESWRTNFRFDRKKLG
jgi:hypothetical protein